jgi:tRNA (adenine57-N1/adenine58-N1)-methyltransferase catalytic subunit
MLEAWMEGETAVLKRPGEPAILVRVVPGPQSVGDHSVLDLGGQIGRRPGEEIRWVGSVFRLLRPSLADLLSTIRRGPQIVMAKDAAHLLFLTGVSPGATVVEAGSGSGALTIALAHAVGPLGHVTSYDRRPDFLEDARRNVDRAGLLDRVTFRERDVARDGLDATEVNGVLLDLPEPWLVVAAARTALRVGGYVGTYTPTYNQLERTVQALRAERFDEVRALELLERPIHVGDGGTRPDFDMLGHTAFLAVGRRVT